jgi:hypothetical protein
MATEPPPRSSSPDWAKLSAIGILIGAAVAGMTALASAVSDIKSRLPVAVSDAVPWAFTVFGLGSLVTLAVIYVRTHGAIRQSRTFVWTAIVPTFTISFGLLYALIQSQPQSQPSAHSSSQSPTPSIPASPSATAAPQTIVPSQSVFYLHGSHSAWDEKAYVMDNSIPTNLPGHSFNVYAPRYTIRWMTSTTLAAGTQIPAGTYKWTYTLTDNHGAEQSVLMIEVGYCPSSQCAIRSPIVTKTVTAHPGLASEPLVTQAPTILPPGGPYVLYLEYTVVSSTSSSMRLAYDAQRTPTSLAIP